MKKFLSRLCALALALVLIVPTVNASAAGTTEYLVQKGDTIGRLARTYGVTVEDILAANPTIKNNMIYAGKTITIPATLPTNVYIAKRGDTLSKIAKANDTTVEELAELNGIKNVNLIYVGQAIELPSAKSEDIVVLFTNDVHCQVGSAEKFGYANIAAYKKDMEETHKYVALVDDGDHIQGDVLGVLSSGLWIVDIMNEVGYDFATLGNHEFDYTVEGLAACAEAADYQYLSCNFVNTVTGKSAYDSYKIVNYGGTKVAFIGITTPETFTKSTPAYFKDEDGNFIYSFCEGNKGKDLYKKVQKTVDAARKAGADYVIALSHLGIDPESKPWTAAEVIAKTTGIDVVLDGHSHSVVTGELVANKNGEDVLLAQTGTKFNNFGKLTITTDGEFELELISADNYSKQDEAVLAKISEINASCEEELAVVAGTASFPLYINDPETGKRLIRTTETNAGDFVADAYRAISGADIAVVNGGGIRVDIPEGEVTVKTLRSLHPFGNELCVVKTTGAHILDLLECSVSKLPEAENGGFQHISGMTFEADCTIPSGVVRSEQGEFVKVEGARRVSNVKVLNSTTGEYEPLDPNKVYTLASHNYMLKQGGDGLTMFMKDELIADGVCLDYEVVLKYFAICDGKIPAEYKNPYGQGRIKITLPEVTE